MLFFSARTTVAVLFALDSDISAIVKLTATLLLTDLFLHGTQSNEITTLNPQE